MKINEFKLADLKSACKSSGCKGYTALPKAELINWIDAHPRSADILAELPGVDSPGDEVEEVAIAPAPGEAPGEEAAATEEEEIKSTQESIRTLSAKMGAEAEGVTRKITGHGLDSCSLSELQKVFGRLVQLSLLVGTDDSEPVPDDELSEDEKAANAFGAKFVDDFLGGDGVIAKEAIAPGEEIEKDAIGSIDAQELAKALTLIFSADPNIYVRNVWENSLIVQCDAGFCVQIRDQGEGDWFCEDLTATAAEGWSLRFNICKEALSQACNSIISQKRELLRSAIAPEKPCPNCGGSGDCGGLEDGCECGGNCPNNFLCPECMKDAIQPSRIPPPQHLRDRAVAIFETSPPDGTGFVPSNGTTGDK